jgi:TIR domain
MIRFPSFEELRSIQAELDTKLLFEKASRSKATKDTFLTRSSKDKEFLPAIIEILTNHGASVYIDKEDERLPEQTSPESAAILRDTIATCRKFVVFVTPQSKASKWIPWELGLGDGIRKVENVTLFPSADAVAEMTWAEQEYLGLYQRIVWGNFEGKANPEWIVYNHVTTVGVPLGSGLPPNNASFIFKTFGVIVRPLA